MQQKKLKSTLFFSFQNYSCVYVRTITETDKKGSEKEIYSSNVQW